MKNLFIFVIVIGCILTSETSLSKNIEFNCYSGPKNSYNTLVLSPSMINAMSNAIDILKKEKNINYLNFEQITVQYNDKEITIGIAKFGRGAFDVVFDKNNLKKYEIRSVNY